MNITPRDLKDSRYKSGYKGVVNTDTPNHPRPERPFQGQASRWGDGPRWRGPARATALEAAWDYANWLNTGGQQPSRSLNSANHKGRRSAALIDDEERAALGVLRDKRAQRLKKAKGYVYCITDGTAVKIGYSLKPEARVAELQTGNPRPLKLLASMEGTPADEKAMHVKYLHRNILQEWFRPTAALLSEFGLNKEVLT